MSNVQKRMNDWKKWNWPYQLLGKDVPLCNILQDNSIFTSIQFFSHSWKWENDDLYMLVKEKDDKTASVKALSSVKSKFKITKAASKFSKLMDSLDGFNKFCIHRRGTCRKRII